MLLAADVDIMQASMCDTQIEHPPMWAFILLFVLMWCILRVSQTERGGKGEGEGEGEGAHG